MLGTIQLTFFKKRKRIKIDIEIESLPRYSHLETIEKYKLLPRNPVCSAREYTICPDGYFDLVFMLSESNCTVLLAGPYTKKAITSLDDFEFFIVRFKVGSLPDLYDVKTLELVDTMIQLPRVFGIQSDTICEILLKENGFDKKQKFIEDLLYNITLQPMIKNNVYCNSTAIIESCHGQIKVDELSSILNVSTRTIERRFNENLGVSPKQFIRLVRFQKTIEKLKNVDAYKTYVDIAYELGFTDKLHFIKEFKSLSGVSPRNF